MRSCLWCVIVRLPVDRRLRNLAAHYAALLREYLALDQETALQKAYELGRKSISLGTGVLDMARIHHDCLALCMGPEELRTVSGERVLKLAEAFFMEALSPFEAAHRGFREANERLKQLNAALAQRNAELDTMNRQLERSED